METMHSERYEITVPDKNKKQRVDTYLTLFLPNASRSKIQKWIKEGHVTINETLITKPNFMVQASDQLIVTIPKPKPVDIIPEEIPLDIIFEDEHLLVLNKEAGMVVHPAVGNFDGTMANALLAHCNSLSSVNSDVRPGIVHRIDKDTSGLLVVAKDDVIHRHLAEQFAEKSVERIYIALVWGHPKPSRDTIETFLGRSKKDRKKFAVSEDGKKAITHYQVLETFPLMSQIQCQLETGRTHQIRVHLSYRHHPIVGDQTYGGVGRQLGGLNQEDTRLAIDILEKMPRQALHAKTLGFVHPATNQWMHFDSDLPKDMQLVIEHLRNEREKRNKHP